MFLEEDETLIPNPSPSYKGQKKRYRASSSERIKSLQNNDASTLNNDKFQFPDSQNDSYRRKGARFQNPSHRRATTENYPLANSDKDFYETPIPTSSPAHSINQPDSSSLQTLSFTHPSRNFQSTVGTQHAFTQPNRQSGAPPLGPGPMPNPQINTLNPSGANPPPQNNTGQASAPPTRPGPLPNSHLNFPNPLGTNAPTNLNNQLQPRPLLIWNLPNPQQGQFINGPLNRPFFNSLGGITNPLGLGTHQPQPLAPSMRHLPVGRSGVSHSSSDKPEPLLFSAGTYTNPFSLRQAPTPIQMSQSPFRYSSAGHLSEPPRQSPFRWNFDLTNPLSISTQSGHQPTNFQMRYLPIGRSGTWVVPETPDPILGYTGTYPNPFALRQNPSQIQFADSPIVTHGELSETFYQTHLAAQTGRTHPLITKNNSSQSHASTAPHPTGNHGLFSPSPKGPGPIPNIGGNIPNPFGTASPTDPSSGKSPSKVQFSVLPIGTHGVSSAPLNQTLLVGSQGLTLPLITNSIPTQPFASTVPNPFGHHGETSDANDVSLLPLDSSLSFPPFLTTRPTPMGMEGELTNADNTSPSNPQETVKPQISIAKGAKGKISEGSKIPRLLDSKPSLISFIQTFNSKQLPLYMQNISLSKHEVSKLLESLDFFPMIENPIGGVIQALKDLLSIQTIPEDNFLITSPSVFAVVHSALEDDSLKMTLLGAANEVKLALEGMLSVFNRAVVPSHLIVGKGILDELPLESDFWKHPPATAILKLLPEIFVPMQKGKVSHTLPRSKSFEQLPIISKSRITSRNTAKRPLSSQNFAIQHQDIKYDLLSAAKRVSEALAELSKAAENASSIKELDKPTLKVEGSLRDLESTAQEAESKSPYHSQKIQKFVKAVKKRAGESLRGTFRNVKIPTIRQALIEGKSPVEKLMQLFENEIDENIPPSSLQHPINALTSSPKMSPPASLKLSEAEAQNLLKSMSGENEEPPSSLNRDPSSNAFDTITNIRETGRKQARQSQSLRPRKAQPPEQLKPKKKFDSYSHRPRNFLGLRPLDEILSRKQKG